VVALVDLDGDLVGVAVPDGDRVHVLGHDELARLVDRLTSGAACLAIEVSDLSDELLGLLGVPNGVAVERVRADAFAPEPSVLGGDVLIAWNGVSVSSAEEFAVAYTEGEPGSLIPYTVLRGNRRVSGRTRLPQMDCRPVSPTRTQLPGLGMTLDQNESGHWQVIAVIESGVAARSGVQEDDHILAVNGTPLGAQDRDLLVRLDEGADTPVVTIERGDRTLLLALDHDSN